MEPLNNREEAFIRAVVNDNEDVRVTYSGGDPISLCEEGAGVELDYYLVEDCGDIVMSLLKDGFLVIRESNEKILMTGASIECTVSCIFSDVRHEVDTYYEILFEHYGFDIYHGLCHCGNDSEWESDDEVEHNCNSHKYVKEYMFRGEPVVLTIIVIYEGSNKCNWFKVSPK